MTRENNGKHCFITVFEMISYLCDDPRGWSSDWARKLLYAPIINCYLTRNYDRFLE